MSGAKQPSPLAGFSYDWVGGDIHGLSAFAGTVYGYAPEMAEVITVLDKSVATVTKDAGWSGDAAGAFSAAWESDSIGATALSAVFEQIGETVDTLAVNLANIERALEDAADEFGAQGVTVGADGTPPTVPDGPYATGSAGAKLQTDVNGYAAAYNLAMGEALQARDQAASALQGLYSQIAPPSPGSTGDSGDTGLSAGDKVSLGDYLRGFWTVPTAYREVAETQVAAAAKVESTAVADFKAAKKLYLANFETQTLEDAKKLRALGDDIGAARTELSAVDKTLDTAESVESKVLGSKLLDTSVTEVVQDLTGLGKGAAEGTAEAAEGVLSQIIKVGDDIPVIDVFVAVAGSGLDSYTDIKNGKPWYEAVPEDTLANVVGVASGVAVVAGAAALAGTATVAAIAGAPAVVVVAGAAVAGVAAIGVTDEVKNLFNENWNQDIHKSGVLAGTLDGVGHSFAKTGDQMGDMAKSAWHGITSIF
jgi:uncharacterized protein YukE